MLTAIAPHVKIRPVELKVESQGDVHFIVPKGELLAGQGDSELKQALEGLREAGRTKVVVDFAAVPYIDSSILGQLVHGYSILKKDGGGLKLLNPSKRIIDVLTLTRLITVFEIFDDRQAAAASWSPSRA